MSYCILQPLSWFLLLFTISFYDANGQNVPTAQFQTPASRDPAIVFLRVQPGGDSLSNFKPVMFFPSSFDNSNYTSTINYKVTWEEAESICELNGMTLASPDSFWMYNDIKKSLKDVYSKWNITKPQTIWMGGAKDRSSDNNPLQWVTNGFPVNDFFYQGWNTKPTSVMYQPSLCTIFQYFPTSTFTNYIGKYTRCCDTADFMCQTKSPQPSGPKSFQFGCLPAFPTTAMTTETTTPTTTTPAPTTTTTTTTTTTPAPTTTTTTTTTTTPAPTTTTTTTTTTTPAPTMTITTATTTQVPVTSTTGPYTTIIPSDCQPDSSSNSYPDYTETTFGGDIYTIVREPQLSWSEAQAVCASQCSTLCEDIVHTSAEFQFLSKLTTCPQSAYSNSSDVWLGRSCTSSGANDCPKMSLDPVSQKTVISTNGVCSEVHPFVCKRPAPILTTTG